MCECFVITSVFFFDKPFSTGKLPHLWKLANMTPLFKKGSKADRNNYRQISLTLVVCKVAEKIVESRVMDFWRNINILTRTSSLIWRADQRFRSFFLVTTIGRNHATAESQLKSPFWIFPRRLTAHHMSVFFSSLSVTVS